MKPPHHYNMMAIFAKRINENFEDDDALSEAFAKLYEATILDRAYKKVMISYTVVLSLGIETMTT